MLPAAAVILAGGQGTRLGGRIKGNLIFDGERLIDRIAAVIDGADPRLVARGAFTEAELPLAAGWRAVGDRSGLGGPLAGVAGAIDHLRAGRGPDLLLSVAVDTPFFPPPFLTVAIEQLRDFDAVVARFAGQDYPTNVLWRVDAAASGIAAGASSLKGLLGALRTVPLEWSEVADADPFASVNTPEDFAALEARGAARFGVGKVGQTR